MGFVFRLMGTGSDSHKRTLTVMRMQKLENCLSGYNAAFGSYPPVKLHGSRDIYSAVDSHGIQKSESNKGLWEWNKIGQAAEERAWDQVRAACKSQPIDCRFPYPSKFTKLVQSVSEEMARRAESGEEFFERYWRNENTKQRLTARFDDGVTQNIGRHSRHKNEVDWRNVQLFKFGLMSFLLPRYLVMMNGDSQFFTDYAQWKDNNDEPCDPFDGTQYTWLKLKQKVDDYTKSNSRSDLARVANIPSQAVCARWMPNLAGICKANHSYSLFGINIRDSEDEGDLHVENVNIEVFSPSGEDSNANQYILDGVTIRDGWGSDLYYYSPSPYQRYTLWSAGPNGRTFPPWVSREGLSGNANVCIGKWTHDDIISLSY